MNVEPDVLTDYLILTEITTNPLTMRMETKQRIAEEKNGREKLVQE